MKNSNIILCHSSIWDGLKVGYEAHGWAFFALLSVLNITFLSMTLYHLFDEGKKSRLIEEYGTSEKEEKKLPKVYLLVFLAAIAVDIFYFAAEL